MESKGETSRRVDLYVETATFDHCESIAENIREADRMEIKAASGMSPLEGIVHSYSFSDIPFTVMVDGVPAAMFGGCPVQSKVGAIWLLGTDLILQNTTRFLRESRFWLDQCARPYDLMFNYVDARNTVHIRWIKWLGFTIINRHDKFGVGKLPFYEFVRIF